MNFEQNGSCDHKILQSLYNFISTLVQLLILEVVVHYSLNTQQNVQHRQANFWDD